MPKTPKIEIIRFTSPQPYPEIHRAQLERRDALRAGTAPNALFLLEHTPVITLGRDAHDENVLLTKSQAEHAGIDICPTDRGGDVTYHGPGQLVAYPILDLRQWKQSVDWYLRTLEQVLVDQLAEYGLPAQRMEKFTGVWVQGAKVAAIGVAVRDWIAFHGVALNVEPNLKHFEHIIPCGIKTKPVTSLAILLKNPPTIPQAMTDFEKHFKNRFALARSEL